MKEQEPTKVNQHPKPFPWKCSTCGKEEVRPTTTNYAAKVKHHGKKYSVEVPELPVLGCGACGEVLFTNSSQAEIDRALRVKLGRLQPEEIRKQRLALGWTQKQLAAYTGAAEATVSRWESGLVIQSKRADRDLRACFDKSLQEAAASVATQGDSTSTASREAVEVFRRCIRQHAVETGKMTSERADSPAAHRERELFLELLDLLADLHASEGDRGLEDAIRHLKWLQELRASPNAVVWSADAPFDSEHSADSSRQAGEGKQPISASSQEHELFLWVDQHDYCLGAWEFAHCEREWVRRRDAAKVALGRALEHSPYLDISLHKEGAARALRELLKHKLWWGATGSPEQQSLKEL